jgi:hypothetical protein
MVSAFADEVALLDHFLSRRAAIVERIEAGLLNVRDKDQARSRHRPSFERLLNGCFFGAAGLDPRLASLQGQLAAKHLTDGFEPVQMGRSSRELDPLDLIVRAYEYWDAHRWPGGSARLAYAQTIYVVFLLRRLEYLTLRIWDDGGEGANARLATLQGLLDRLNALASGRPRALVRDVRWLVQTAQGPITKHLGPYFRVAGHISESLAEPTRLGVHAAGAKLTGGHLRSQLWYRADEMRAPVDDPAVLAVNRNSNALDGALLLRDLLPLMTAYDAARATDDGDARLDLADAILQGLSADPELWLVRLDLLGPCIGIEDLFVERDDARRARLTALGRAQSALLDEYCGLIGRLAAPLREDAASLSGTAYSPHGLIYGFVSEILACMALETLASAEVSGLSLEDMFESRRDLDVKLARARVWSALPRRAGERQACAHSEDVAASRLAQVMAALDARAARPNVLNASSHREARIYVSEGPAPADVPAGVVAADEYCETGGTLADRHEGRFLASVEVDGAWFGVSKAVLTRFTSEGRDALITNVPPQAIDVLRLTCPGLIEE